jgi:sugar/nucleoside kinase (ribokinase family)
MLGGVDGRPAWTPTKSGINPRVLSADAHSCHRRQVVSLEFVSPKKGKMDDSMRVPVTLPPADRAVDVVTLGENSLDFVAVAGRVPAASGKQRLDDFRLEPGGQMATAALASARLGLRTRYIGVFGDDEWSRRARAPLDAAGIDVVAVVRSGVPGRIAVILVDAAGERTVFERRDVNLVLEPAFVSAAAVETSRLLLADATQPDATLRAVAVARAAGTISVSDVDQVTPAAEAILAEVDVAVVPAPFVTTWAGTTDLDAGLERLARHCRRAALVITTRGADGSVAWCGGQLVRTPGVAVEVVDTTGAGDAFRAGLVSALVHLGPDAALADVLRFANAAGALNCRAVGAQTGLPSLDEVMAHVTPGRSGLSK